MATNQMICEFWSLSSFLNISRHFILSQNVFINKVIFTGDISLYLNSKPMHNISKYYIMSSHNIIRLIFLSKRFIVILNPRKYRCKLEFVLINSYVRRWLMGNILTLIWGQNTRRGWLKTWTLSHGVKVDVRDLEIWQKNIICKMSCFF